MKKNPQTQVEFGPEVPGYAQLNEALRAGKNPDPKPVKNRKPKATKSQDASPGS